MKRIVYGFFLVMMCVFLVACGGNDKDNKTPTPEVPTVEEPTPDEPVEPTPEDPTQPVEPTPEDPDKDTFKLNLDLDGGDCDNLPTEYTNGNVLVLPEPMRGEDQFCGWRDEDGKLYYIIDFDLEKDLNLKAKWMPLGSDLSFEIYDGMYIIQQIPTEFYLDNKPKLDEAREFLKTLSSEALDNIYNLSIVERCMAEYKSQKELVDEINNDIVTLQSTPSVELADKVVENYLLVPEQNIKYIEGFNEFSKILLEVNNIDINIDKIIPDSIIEEIALPNDFEGSPIIWESSDKKLIKISDGSLSVNKAYQNHVKKDVEISFIINFKGLDVKITKNCKVSPIVHCDIPVSPVAAYINIGAMSHYVTYNNRNEVFSDRIKETLDLAYYSFAVPSSSGSITLQGGFHDYYDALMDLKNHDTRVLLVLGGSGTSKAFSDIAADSNKLNRFIDNLVKLLLEYNFDGVDIDWEYPGYETGKATEEDAKNYVTMFKMIKARLEALQDKEGTKFILTSAIPGTSWGIARYDVPGLNQCLDYVNIMSYDLNNGDKATHLSAVYNSSKDGGYGFSADYAVKKFVQLGFDKSKLIVGAATYGKAYKISDTSATVDNVLGKSGKLTQVTGVAGAFASGTIYYYAIKQLLFTSSDYKMGLEKTSGGKIVGSYIYNQKNNIFITYESDVMFEAKYEYALENGVGIMCWSMPEDATDTYINSIHYVNKRMNIK